MALPVRLSDIIDELKILPEDATIHIDRNTGEMVLVSDEEAGIVTNEEPDESLRDAIRRRRRVPAVQVVIERVEPMGRVECVPPR